MDPLEASSRLKFVLNSCRKDFAWILNAYYLIKKINRDRTLEWKAFLKVADPIAILRIIIEKSCSKIRGITKEINLIKIEVKTKNKVDKSLRFKELKV